MTAMSSARIVIARIGYAGIHSVCRIAFALAQMTPNQRPQLVPRQIANAAKYCAMPSASRNQPQVLRSPKM